MKDLRAQASVLLVALLGSAGLGAAAQGIDESPAFQELASISKAAAKPASEVEASGLSPVDEGLRRAFLEDRLKHALSPTELVKKVLDKKKPRVLLLGETHNFGAGAKGYDSLLSMIDSAGFRHDCVTFEEDAPVQSDLEKVIGGEISAEEYVKRIGFIADYAQPHASLYKYVRDKKEKPFAVGLSNPYSIDDVVQGRVSYQAFHQSLTMTNRNIETARHIAALLVGKKCQGIVHVGGARHLSSSASPQMTLPKLLETYGVSAASIQLESLSKDAFVFGQKIDRALYWDGASWNPSSLPKEAFGFVPKDTPLAIQRIQDETGYALWRAVDGFLFLP